MFNNLDKILRIACLILAAILCYELSRMIIRPKALDNLNLPALPTLTLSTNSADSTAAAAKTNSVPGQTNGVAARPGNSPRVGGRPGGPGGPELPPAIRARVDKVVQSEILTPIIRPPPMALLGIAGQDAFLRAPNGQTGIIKEGEEIGGLKLIKIGINRVLVEEQGQKKELTIFSGVGSESLLPKE